MASTAHSVRSFISTTETGKKNYDKKEKGEMYFLEDIMFAVCLTWSYYSGWSLVFCLWQAISLGRYELLPTHQPTAWLVGLVVCIFGWLVVLELGLPAATTGCWILRWGEGSGCVTRWEGGRALPFPGHTLPGAHLLHRAPGHHNHHHHQW